MQCVTYFINADEAVYGSNKHKLEYNPTFLNQIATFQSVKQHWQKLRILCATSKNFKSTSWITL